MPLRSLPSRTLRRAWLVVPFALLGGALPASVDGQVTVVDEGTFSLVVGGARVGREDFSIRRTPLGSFVAQGNVLRGDTRAAVVLNTDSAGSPERYRFDANLGGAAEERVSGERRLTLWSGLATRPTGESGREFRLPAGSNVADQGVLHHLWFLLRFSGEGATPLLDPRTMTMRRVIVEDAGLDRVTIGLDDLEAHRWIVRGIEGGALLREVWTDAAGRLLRVRAPAEDLDATRDEPPPETPAAGPAYEVSDHQLHL